MRKNIKQSELTRVGEKGPSSGNAQEVLNAAAIKFCTDDGGSYQDDLAALKGAVKAFLKDVRDDPA